VRQKKKEGVGALNDENVGLDNHERSFQSSM